MKKFSILPALTALAFAACSDSEEVSSVATSPNVTSSLASLEKSGARFYDVTIENLTTGQPLSPGVFVTHGKDSHLFQVGKQASEGIRVIAEDGDPSVAEAALLGQQGVHEVVATAVPIHRVGGPGPNTLTVRISARARFNRLSLATMLICTNDGFTGLDGVKLPGGFKPKEIYVVGYDAGTEANDELSTSIVDACGAIGPVPMLPDGNSRSVTSDVITHHPGIQGGASLDPAEHGWQDPVARVTIQRVE